ncbi:MAG: hypothetical protein LUG83_03520 [Lachnospiraceae bacterium]|nr:hypothetical protein [Lachnospiraceae bacterium]
MAVMDEFKDERNEMKNASLNKKISYFWYYNKWYVIGGLIAFVIIAAFIHDMVTKKEAVMEAALLNSSVHLEDTEEYNEKFLSYMEIDSDKYSLSMDTSLKISFGIMDETAINSSEKLSAYVAASILDTIIAGDDIFSSYANAGIFKDLREALSEEEIEKYSDFFYYVDTEVVKQVQLAETEMDSSLRPEIPDPTKPELMDEPVAVGIYIDDCTEFLDVYTFPDSDCVVMGILTDAPHETMTVTFLNYIFENG